MTVTIVPATLAHCDGWARLRDLLWPGDGVDQQRADVAEWLADADHAAFVALHGDDVVGFVEASIRRDHVNGCDTSPVAFGEGIAVMPSYRGRGIARRLGAAVEAWARARGCTEIGSDADLDNGDGQALHLALGFEERERVVFYRRVL